jgi:hypothetical protein
VRWRERIRRCEKHLNIQKTYHPDTRRRKCNSSSNWETACLYLYVPSCIASCARTHLFLKYIILCMRIECIWCAVITKLHAIVFTISRSDWLAWTWTRTRVIRIFVYVFKNVYLFVYNKTEARVYPFPSVPFTVSHSVRLWKTVGSCAPCCADVKRTGPVPRKMSYV